MEKMSLSVLIEADTQKVWNTMLNLETYRIWTKAFHEGSFYEGNWEKGSEILFLGPDENGKLGGMYSRIKENIPFNYISVEHLGMVKDGVVDTTSEEVKKWTPAFENYTFSAEGIGTRLVIDMDIEESHKQMFEDLWAKALAALKELCER